MSLATGPKSNFNEFQQRPNTSATLPKTDFNLLDRPAGTGSERDGVTVEKGLIWDQGNLRLLLEDTSMETLKQRIEAEQKRGEENYKRTLQEEKRAKIATENSRKGHGGRVSALLFRDGSTSFFSVTFGTA